MNLKENNKIKTNNLKIITNISIVNLADDIKYLGEASMYMWKEWAEQYGTRLEDIVYRTRHCLNKDSIPQTYIAKINDELVGVVSIWNNDLPFRQDLTPWLAGLYVKEKYRGIGIGKLLQNECIEVVKQLGYKKLYLITEHENYYERYGWIFIEKAPLRGGNQTRLYEFNIINM